MNGLAVEMLELVAFQSHEFPLFRERAIQNYAEAWSVGMDAPHDAAVVRAAQAFGSLLPQGMDTPGHSFFWIHDQGIRAGSLWVGLIIEGQSKRGFVYDIWLEETCRGRGLGEAVMRRYEELARKQGARSIALNVFAHNGRARRLYEKLGYAEGTLMLKKPI